jgi:hypothetical protein
MIHLRETPDIAISILKMINNFLGCPLLDRMPLSTLNNFHKEHGIRKVLTCVGAPQQLGESERLNLSLCLHKSGLD